MPKDVKLKKYEDVLMSALKFDDDDLAANIAGNFSVAQVQRLKRRRVAQAITIAVICAIIVLVVLLMATVSVQTAPPLLILTALFGGLALLFGTITSIQVTRDLQDGIKVIEGRVQLDMTPAQNSATYYVKVEGKKFKVKKAAFLAFKNGDPYRIYYAPHSKTILSVEWMRDDNPFEEDADQRGEDVPLVEDEPMQRYAKQRS